MIKYNVKITEALFAVFCIAVGASLFRYTMLSEKYFYDSNTLLRLIGSSSATFYSGSFEMAAAFHRVINIFDFSSQIEWSLFYTSVFFIPIAYIFYVAMKSGNNIYFLTASAFLAFVYVCVISKDVITFIVALVIWFLLMSKRKDCIKGIVPFLLLLVLGTFRSYYIIIAVFYAAAYIISWFILGRKENKPTRLLHILVIAFSGVLLCLLLLKAIIPDAYEEILRMHSRLNKNRINSPDAITQINDLIPFGDNLILYMLNYIINLVRLLFPLELLFVDFSIKYLMFIIWQLFFTVQYIRCLINFNESKKSQALLIPLCIMTAFVLVSALFEPDFGSFIRHQIAFFPMITIVYIRGKEFSTWNIHKT
jgi:hypothetical protein